MYIGRSARLCWRKCRNKRDPLLTWPGGNVSRYHRFFLLSQGESHRAGTYGIARLISYHVMPRGGSWAAINKKPYAIDDDPC